MAQKIWFITGSSRGFGRIWTEAALERGDKVAATARKLESISGLKEKYRDNILPLQLDVTDQTQVNKAVEQAYNHFGKLDIVVNNAGYALVSTIEEGNPEEIRALYETNIIGPVSVIKAALPYLRQQKSGHIIGVSSNLGHVTLPVIGYYCSSKWAFESIHEALAEEVKDFGIKVTIIEPGAYATEFGSQDSLKFANGMEEYQAFKTNFMQSLQQLERGNPAATPQAVFTMVDDENPPLRFFLGNQNLPWVRKAYADRLAEWEKWEAVSNSAQ